MSIYRHDNNQPLKTTKKKRNKSKTNIDKAWNPDPNPYNDSWASPSPSKAKKKSKSLTKYNSAIFD